MHLTIPGFPIAKARPRFSGGGRVFDKQKKERNFFRCIVQQQLAKKRILSLVSGVCSAEIIFHTPMPMTWSQKRKECENGNLDPTRPDVDNYLKFTLDGLNELVYADDNQVAEIYCKKMYSKNPRTEIYISSGDSEMIKEHALTVKGEIKIEDLDYMVKKANRLGTKGRKVVRVYTEQDNEGHHYYFDCEQTREMP